MIFDDIANSFMAGSSFHVIGSLPTETTQKENKESIIERYDQLNYLLFGILPFLDV